MRSIQVTGQSFILPARTPAYNDIMIFLPHDFDPGLYVELSRLYEDYLFLYAYRTVSMMRHQEGIFAYPAMQQVFLSWNRYQSYFGLPTVDAMLQLIPPIVWEPHVAGSAFIDNILHRLQHELGVR